MQIEKLRSTGIATLLVLLISVPAFAHHSITMYDRNIETSISGVVAEWEWANPHCWLQIMVMDENGTPRLWSIEANSTGQMGRGGWTADSVKPGDEIIVTMNPLRDGTRGGRLGSVRFSDGRVLYRAGDISGTRANPF